MFFLLIVMLLLISLCSAAENTHVTENTAPLTTQHQEIQQKKTLSTIIQPYKPTFLLPFSYNGKLQEHTTYNDGMDFQDMEIEFQISLKMPIAENMFDSGLSLYFAYTQRSFWQAYNYTYSSPFRETNYEPELFAIWENHTIPDKRWHFQSASLAVIHQSNGRDEMLSRSWSRIESRLKLSKQNCSITLTPWLRIEERESHDNNPDLLDYLGHGQLTIAYKFAEHAFSFTSRNNIQSKFSQGSVQGTWSFPIYANVRGYIKAFSGYGNSLIEYNTYTNTFGVGISVTDWL